MSERYHLCIFRVCGCNKNNKRKNCEQTTILVLSTGRRRTTATMNFFGNDTKQQQGPDPVVAATTEMQMYTGKSSSNERSMLSLSNIHISHHSVPFHDYFSGSTGRLVQQNCVIVLPKVHKCETS